MQFFASLRRRCGSQSAIESLCNLNNKPRGNHLVQYSFRTRFEYHEFLKVPHMNRDFLEYYKDLKHISKEDAEQDAAEMKLRMEVNGDWTDEAEKKRQEEDALSKVYTRKPIDDLSIRASCLKFEANPDDYDSEPERKNPGELQQGESNAADTPPAIQSKKKVRLDLNSPNLDDPVELTAIEKMKIQIQALHPENRKVHPKHKKCPVCQKHFYHRHALLSHMKNKWKCRQLLPKQFAELIEID